MKKYSLVFFFAFVPLVVFAYVSPGKPVGLVNDFAHILKAPEAQSIGARLAVLERSTGAEVTVVSIPSLGDETIETYAAKLFEEWKIGDEKKDTGLLLLVAVKEREIRIETGYGLEGAVTDIQSGNIIRNIMTPAFKTGKYGEGISGAVDALVAVITKSPEAAQYSAPPPDSSKGWDVNFAGLFFFVIIILNSLARFLGKTRSWWLGGVLGAVMGVIIGFIATSFVTGFVSTLVLTVLGLVFDFVVSKRPPGSGGGGFWPIFLGGGRGGSGGGVFSGFGGGMSGGGGASGRW